MPDFPEIHYQIDARDSLVSINDAWVQEAERVPEPGLASRTILGRGLWQLIKDWPLQSLFDGIFRRLRAGEIPRAAYLFRCDTPTSRRLHRLLITAGSNHSLHFKSTIVAIHERPKVPLLDTTIPRSTEVLRICSWCKRIPLPGEGWVEVEDALGRLDALDAGPMPALSHGMCPACSQTMLFFLDRPSAVGPDIATFGEWRPT